jgi:DNA-binding transcriptional ArsR family regulator
MGESSDESRTGSQTVDRATRLLRYVCAAGEAGRQLSEIVKQSGLTKPTVRRILIALIDNGLLEQDEDRKYFAGPETYALGILAAARFRRAQATRPRSRPAGRDFESEPGSIPVSAIWHRGVPAAGELPFYFCQLIPRVILLVFLLVSTTSNDENYFKFKWL